MIVTIEKPFNGPAHWARSYIGSRVRTPQGYGKVTEAEVKPDKGVVVLKVWVKREKEQQTKGTP